MQGRFEIWKLAFTNFGRKFSKTFNMAAQVWWKLTAKGAVLSPIECPPGWTFLGDYNNKEWIKLSLFQCPQLVGKSPQRARYVLKCNNSLARISILQTDISLSQDILRHFPFPTWNFFLRNVPESLSLSKFLKVQFLRKNSEGRK